MISKSVAEFLRRARPRTGQAEQSFAARVELAEIYSSCRQPYEECLARYQQSSFKSDPSPYFEGFYALCLEACRLTHIAAADIPGSELAAVVLEARMRRIIDHYQTDLGEHALVLAGSDIQRIARDLAP